MILLKTGYAPLPATSHEGNLEWREWQKLIIISIFECTKCDITIKYKKNIGHHRY